METNTSRILTHHYLTQILATEFFDYFSNLTDIGNCSLKSGNQTILLSKAYDWVIRDLYKSAHMLQASKYT